MTGNRVSAVFTPEATLGTTPTNPTWYRFPSGLTLDYTPTNNLTEYGEMGSKFSDRVLGGMFSGSGTVKFKLDYNCITVLGWAFEDYGFSTGKHTFQKVNNKRVKPISIRVKKLNRIVGGNSTKDSTVILKGCVCTNIQFSQTGRDAPINVTVSFDYINEVMDLSDLATTDWDEYYNEDDPEYDGDAIQPVEWACLNIGDTPVAYTESVSFGVSNSLGMVKGCGTRFNSNYEEGKASISLSTTVYSYDGRNYYTRMYSGGSDNTMLSPKEKNLQPIPTIKVKSSMTNPALSCTAIFTKVYVNSLARNFDPNSRINDSPNLKVGGTIAIEITNAVPSIATIWE